MVKAVLQQTGSKLVQAITAGIWIAATVLIPYFFWDQTKAIFTTYPLLAGNLLGLWLVLGLPVVFAEQLRYYHRACLAVFIGVYALNMAYVGVDYSDRSTWVVSIVALLVVAGVWRATLGTSYWRAATGRVGVSSDDADT